MALLPRTPLRDHADIARFEAELMLDERLPERSDVERALAEFLFESRVGSD